MPKIRYRDLRLGPKALERVDQANTIIADYAAQGFDLTLRQLFYQFVSRGLLANTQREYKNLGSTVNDARLAGLIDWDSIVDRTRNLRALSHWDGPEEIVRACAQQFHYDLWDTQPNYVEVWIEKDALVGVIEDVCNRWDVPHFSCRGYTSQSEMWVAARRIMAKTRPQDGPAPPRHSARPIGRRPAAILHLGDHDPSGMDMTRDIQDRLNLFGADVQVVRLALNPNQVEQYDPPPNPAKITDSRAAAYIAQYGDDSWELDALDPPVIVALIEDALRGLVNVDAWESAKLKQDGARFLLKGVADSWPDVVQLLDEGGDA
jgi:hypothetical protein